MSEEPTRPIRPGEYGSPGGYGSSRDYCSPDGYGADRGAGAGRGYGQGRGPDPGYGQGYGPDGGYGQGYAPPGGGYGQGSAADGYRSAPGTARMPDEGYRDEVPTRGRRGGRGHRGLNITAIVVVVLLVLLVVADRVAAGVAENAVASQIKSQGFPVKPKVTISGFPFLTQLATRDFQQMNISANNVTEGLLDIASVNATLHGVHINSGFNGATVDQVNGTALVTFGALSHAAGIGDGITLSDAGNGDLKATIDLGFVSGTALARVTRAGPHEINVGVISAGGIPLSALGPLRDFNISVPNLPAGMTIQNVSVTGQGLRISIAGTHTTFSQ